MKRTTMLLLALLAGCTKAPIETQATNNAEMPVDLLFTNDGCNVYRFYDNGRFSYYADCGSVRTSHTQSSGKTTVEVPDDIPNARPKR